jgi:hypothetical protein
VIGAAIRVAKIAAGEEAVRGQMDRVEEFVAMIVAPKSGRPRTYKKRASVERARLPGFFKAEVFAAGHRSLP